MILRLKENKKLSFYQKNPIYIGEKDFDIIEVLIPPKVDNNNTENLNFILHIVNKKGEYIHINLEKEQRSGEIVGTTKIGATITNETQDFFLYLEMVKGEKKIIGKTNCVEITIEPLPDENTRIIPKEEYEEIIDELTEIIQKNTDAMNRINKFEDGKSAYEIAVEHGYLGTEEEWLLEMKDYSKLNNKPSINNIELNGNKTTSDLGLQDKLTAGQNITIEGNVISAEGGVTSYEDLTDKPKVLGNTGRYDLDKILYFPDFDLSLKGWVRQLSLKPLNYGKLENGESYYIHEEFKNRVNLNVPTLDLYGKWFCFDANNAVGLPSGIDVVTSRYENQSKKVVWGSYRSCQINAAFVDIELPLIEEIYWTDSNLKNHHAVRTYFKDTTNVKKFTDWTELTGGGSQIVSGVVNVNGTITFTDSDGNSFTTSGESVIGPQGAPGQDYVLTAQDKTDIANIVLGELPTTEGVLYGNTSN